MKIEAGHNYTASELLQTALSKGSTVEMSKETEEKVKACFDFLQQKITQTAKPIYGVNTGFGSLCNTIISHDNLQQLQENLLLSHACGTGERVPEELVRLMLLLKVLSLSKGHSGVKPDTVHFICELFNKNLLPEIFEMGSLGASGDLAPLAHMSLPLIGKGSFYFDNQVHEVESNLKKHKLNPIKLDAKEGLALINGTQFMAAYGIYCIRKLKHLMEQIHKIAALSCEAFDCKPEPFFKNSHQIRPHTGQQYCAQKLHDYLKDSEIIYSDKEHVQDPYSFRCMPQVHGASYDVIVHAEKIFETEINGVTDNPNVFPQDDLILSAGNFHGQPLALQLDFLAIAASELGNISERRTFQLISGQRGLPAFLTPNPGLNSGMMIMQYTAASLVSQNKGYCFPSSVDSIVSSNGQEDHVSMGANAATKLYKVVKNLDSILAIELVCAAQALEFRELNKAGKASKAFHQSIRQTIPFIKNDSYMHPLIKEAEKFLAFAP